MRQVAVAVVIAGFMFVAPSATAVAGGTAEVSPGTPLTTAETLLGAWTGQWRAADGTPGGSLGLVLARVPGRDTVVGQFTFIAGAVSRTLRYEGRLDEGVVRFPLVDDGHIVLEPDARRAIAADRLSGRWTDYRGALPAAHGTIELERAS